MKKEAIIDLIKSDLEEIGTLVETFREPDRIAQDFIVLLRQKCDGISKEIALLNYWSTENMPEASAAELVAQVPSSGKAQESPSTAKVAKTEPKKAAEPKTAPEPKRNEVPDYFADELEKMDDPLADMSFAQGPSSMKKEAAPTMAQAAEVKPVEFSNEAPEPTKAETTAVEVKLSSVAAEKAPAKQIVPAPTPQTEPKVAKKEEPAQAKQPAKHAQASAADIANYGTPVSDITKAIGINDRFLYQRELFNGNKQALDEALAAINQATSFNQAYIYIKQFGWDESDPTAEAFLKAVHRRFI